MDGRGLYGVGHLLLWNGLAGWIYFSLGCRVEFAGQVALVVGDLAAVVVDGRGVVASIDSADEKLLFKLKN